MNRRPMCRQAKQVVYLGKDSNEHDGQGTELLKSRNTAAHEATCVAASRDDVLGRFVKRQSYDERKTVSERNNRDCQRDCAIPTICLSKLCTDHLSTHAAVTRGSMSGVCRSFRTAHKAFLPVKSASLHQQKRLIGDLPVKPNKYIEDWGTYRENVEYTFKWNSASFFKIALFGMAVPATIYTVAVREFDNTDEAYNRPKRDFMGNAAESKARR